MKGDELVPTKLKYSGKDLSVKIQKEKTTMKELCFLCGPCRDVISKGQGQLIVRHRGLKKRDSDN
jgi:hypothetical protein